MNPGCFSWAKNSTEIPNFMDFVWILLACYWNIYQPGPSLYRELGRSYDRNLVNGCQWWGLLYFRVIEAGQKSGQLFVLLVYMGFIAYHLELYEISRCCSNVSGFLVSMNPEMILFCLIEDSPV